MKYKPFPFLLFVLLTTFAHAQARAQYGPQPLPPMISTNGSAEIHVKPDVADLSFEIDIRNVDLAAARKQQSAIAAKLLAALRAGGIAEPDLKTSQITVTPAWNERRGTDPTTVKYYSVLQTVSCTVHDVDKVPDLTTSALNAGVTGVSPAVFRVTDLRKYRDQARVQAIRAAKEKAVALAGELDAKAGKPYSINETELYRYWGAGAMGNNSIQNVSVAAPAGDDDALSSFAPGTITVTASIQVSFLLE